MAQTNTGLPNTTVPASEVPAGQSTVTTSLVDDLYFSLFSNFHGPSVQHLSSAETVNAKGAENPAQRQYFDSEVLAAYKLNETQGIGVVVPFFLMPTKGGDFSLGDVGAKIYDKKAIATKDFTLAANLILQAPTSSYSRERGMQFGIKSTPSLRYNIPSSRFSIGAWTEAKAYLGAFAGRTFKLYGAPYVNYQLAPKWALMAEYEYEAGHFVGTTPLDFSTVQHDILTGFIYSFSPHFMVNPYLALYTTEKLSMGNAALGAIISASI